MMFLREHARRASRLSDFLPWAAMVAPGIVLDKDGSIAAARATADEAQGREQTRRFLAPGTGYVAQSVSLFHD